MNTAKLPLKVNPIFGRSLPFEPNNTAFSSNVQNVSSVRNKYATKLSSRAIARAAAAADAVTLATCFWQMDDANAGYDGDDCLANQWTKNGMTTTSCSCSQSRWVTPTQDAVGDDRLRLRCRHIAISTKQRCLSSERCRHLANCTNTRRLWFWPIPCIIWKHDVIPQTGST